MRVVPLLAVLLAVPSLTAAQALPQGFPKYEIDQRCAAATTTEDARRTCVSTNQDGYLFARAVWPDASAETRAKCVAVVNRADQPPGRYALPYDALADCLSQFLETDRVRGQGAFTY